MTAPLDPLTAIVLLVLAGGVVVVLVAIFAPAQLRIVIASLFDLLERILYALNFPSKPKDPK